jgi:hypothetical protein
MSKSIEKNGAKKTGSFRIVWAKDTHLLIRVTVLNFSLKKVSKKGPCAVLHFD